MVRGTFGAEYRPQLPPIVAPLTEHDYIFWFNFNVAYQISVSSYCPWLIDQLPISVAHQILSANYFLRRSSGDPMRQVVGMGPSIVYQGRMIINLLLILGWWEICCGFGLKQSSFKVQWWTVVSLALCIVVLAELINNNLSAAAAGAALYWDVMQK